MKIPVVIYTTPACVQCAATARRMDTLGIIYDKVDLTQHPGLADKFREMGHTQAPIVVTDRKTWSGFRLEKIDSLARFLASDEAKS
jgi:glutaredoxin-like protein NrdH|tara:strand:+ start:1522 stop:1779 length:258 start_codon:yes stop_codon:yes gene_type:complete